MLKTIHAIYENGAFYPIEPIDLPDQCEVEVEVRSLGDEKNRPTLDDVYAILNKRFDSGQHAIAERHNQHQP